MALQDALSFLREARHDEEVGRELDGLHDEVTLDSLAAIAERAGFACTADELARAYVLV